VRRVSKKVACARISQVTKNDDPRYGDLHLWRERVLETSAGEEAFGRRFQELGLRGRPLGGEEFVHLVGRPERSGPDGSDQRSDQISFGIESEHFMASPSMPSKRLGKMGGLRTITNNSQNQSKDAGTVSL
jgi:hypothetical protein